MCTYKDNIENTSQQRSIFIDDQNGNLSIETMLLHGISIISLVDEI